MVKDPFTFFIGIAVNGKPVLVFPKAALYMEICAPSQERREVDLVLGSKVFNRLFAVKGNTKRYP